MKFAAPIVLSGLLAGCYNDETLHAYGAAEKVWRLTELSGAPFADTATLTFPQKGQIAGQAPCNSYMASQDVPYPWFKAGPIAATRMACPALKAENTYFQALSTATLSEIAGDTLILSNDEGVLLVFKSAD